MIKKILFSAFSFALLAAIGNAMFAFGQKKSVISKNPFIFLQSSLLVTLIILTIASSFFYKEDILNFIKLNWKWSLVSGIGFALTFIGFYFLYSNFGTSYYVLYAVCSILTTSIIVGIVIFREELNIYYIITAILAILAIVVFAIGKTQGSLNG